MKKNQSHAQSIFEAAINTLTLFILCSLLYKYVVAQAVVLYVGEGGSYRDWSVVFYQTLFYACVAFIWLAIMRRIFNRNIQDQALKDTIIESGSNNLSLFFINLILLKILISPVIEWHISTGGNYTDWVVSASQTTFFTAIGFFWTYLFRRAFTLNKTKSAVKWWSRLYAIRLNSNYSKQKENKI